MPIALAVFVKQGLNTAAQGRNHVCRSRYLCRVLPLHDVIKMAILALKLAKRPKISQKNAKDVVGLFLCLQFLEELLSQPNIIN